MLVLADSSAALRPALARVRARLDEVGPVRGQVTEAVLAPLPGTGTAAAEVVLPVEGPEDERRAVAQLRRALAGLMSPGDGPTDDGPTGDGSADDGTTETDVAVVPASHGGLPRVVVLDVDSTLVTGEVVEMLAAHAGVEAQVARVTAAAMRGELDFAGSLHERVALLAGLPVGVLDDVLAEVVPSPGAAAMAAALAGSGVPVGVVSGGFAEVVEPLAASLGIPRARANRLEVSAGRLTGRVAGDVVDAAAKERFLVGLAARHDVPLAGAVAVGDGANDLAMVRAAGTGVAFCARPVLAAAADVVLRRRDLAAVAHLVGVAGEDPRDG